MEAKMIKRRRQSWLVWALCVAAMLCSIGGGIAELAARPTIQTSDLFSALWFHIFVMPTLAITGALIVARRPDNRIGLLLLVPALLLSIIGLIDV
jgi:hypothetical protein